MRRPRKRHIAFGLFALVFIWWLFCLPRPLFDAPLATVVFDRQEQLLSAQIAADGQWRMPAADSLSDRLGQAIISFEDQRFYRHWGVDFKALARAIRQNWRAGQVVSGGSTLSMQVIRLSRGNPRRTLWQKGIEVLMAWRLEWSYTKDEILRYWAANASFGGNVVGVEAAAWRYFGRSPMDLSWAEAATLAVLPNSPALIHPGRSRDQLLRKRNFVLDRLLANGQLDSLTADLAKAEPLPQAPLALPRRAPHLLQRLVQAHGPGRYYSSIDGPLQAQATELLLAHHQRLNENQIHNLALQITEVATGQTLAYVGNVPGLDARYSPDVDLVQAARSPGSLLKPLLYGLALEEGLLLPRQLLSDVPVTFRQFSPANFNEDFSGAVPADQALARSLNVPFVLLLREYGIDKMHAYARKLGFDFLDQPASHYGLSLVLGGCEVSLEQMSGWFLGLARQQRYYYERQGHYAPLDWEKPSLLQDELRSPLDDLQEQSGPIGAGAGYAVLQALRQLERPNESGEWQRFSGDRSIAWKTGTSFGFRDAWAVGSSPDYVVAVWAGNADGEGRPGLVGVQAAAPLLFQVFRSLPRGQDWFESPYDELRQLPTCRSTGYLRGPYCAATDSSWSPKTGIRGAPCPYHQRIFTDRSGSYRTQLSCAADEDVRPTPWLVLPAREAFFYQRDHPEYRPLPDWSPACRGLAEANGADQSPMQLIYPNSPGRISLGRNWKGEKVATVFQVAHREPETSIHWHLDEQYLGRTNRFHSFELMPDPGSHLLTLVDENGYRLSYHFEVL
ncbi:MAG: penicillin-binding protein 1C [Bacteroidota bacterium]